MRPLLPILLVACSLQFVAAQDRIVDSITIKSMWGGILEQSDTEVVYRRRDEQLFLDRRPVDPRKVQSLIETLNARPVPRDKAFTARIFQLWLDRHAPFAANLQPGWGGTAWTARFEALFRDRDAMAEMFDGLFDTVTLDDKTWVELHVKFGDGEEWSAESYSNHLFMLPWTVRRGGKVVETFDLNIARAIGLLLPEKAVNRGRLLGEDAPEKLGRQINRRLDAAGTP